MLMAATAAHAQDLPRDRVDAIPSLMDATVPKLMEAGHVPGTSIAIVHDGRIVLLTYGTARIDTGARVDPARTAFRIGSVSKTLTAIAIMQLMDAGLLDLHASTSGSPARTPMLALLGDGSVDGQRILTPESTRALMAAQYSVHARIPATAYGMTHWKTIGQDLLH
jgi:hypothetical protein